MNIGNVKDGPGVLALLTSGVPVLGVTGSDLRILKLVGGFITDSLTPDWGQGNSSEANSIFPALQSSFSFLMIFFRSSSHPNPCANS